MSSQISAETNRTYLIIIGVLSVVVPLLVALLFFGNNATRIEGLDVSFLPHLNAVMNSSTFIALVLGFIMIKRKNIALHRTFMMSAFVLSSIFLISYVIYHNNAESTIFGDLNGNKVPEEAEKVAIGAIRYFYLFILLTHILLAIIVVPLVLLAIYFAWTNQVDRHKKIVKYTYPVWTYVAFTGVLVYLMISPYYQ